STPRWRVSCKGIWLMSSARPGTSVDQFVLLLTVSLIILLASASKAFSQSVNVGVKISGYQTKTFGRLSGHYPINLNNTNIQFAAEQYRFDSNIGPTVQVFTPWRLALEVDVLQIPKTSYSREFFFQQANTDRTRGTLDTVVHAWEIPVLAQWHSSNRAIRGLL